MYRVSVDNEETYLMVMRNMFSHRLVVHRKYDLKVRGHPRAPRGGLGRVSNVVSLQGSLVDREASDKERVKKKKKHLFICRLPPLSWKSKVPLPAVGKRAAHLQGHGLQEQHAEGVRE